MRCARAVRRDLQGYDRSVGQDSSITLSEADTVPIHDPQFAARVPASQRDDQPSNVNEHGRFVLVFDP
jgi:hypothetical protein